MSNIDSNTTMEYIEGLTERELRNMREAYALAGLRKMIRIFIKDYGMEAPTWIYLGHREDHIVIPKTYCTCKNFNIGVMTRKQLLSCKHLIVQWIAERNNRYRTLRINIDDYRKIIKEILEIGISPTIRKLLYMEKTKR